MLDRLDLHIEVPPVDYNSLNNNVPQETSAQIRERVNAARQAADYQKYIQSDEYKFAKENESRIKSGLGYNVNNGQIYSFEPLTKDSLQESVPLRNSIGVKNMVTRMMLLFGDDFSIDINSTPGQGSEFILRFPFSE